MSVSKQQIYNKLKSAFPVILFFLVLFYTVLFLFGFSYIMIVSLITVIFQGNYKKPQSAESLMKLILLQFSLAVLAFAATQSFPLCLTLNILVPFWLIFMKSSQFNPMGYFSGLMTFTFLQLMPVDFHGFCIQMAVFAYGMLYFLGAIALCQHRQKPLPAYQLEQQGLLLFSQWMTKELTTEEHDSEISRLYSLQQTLYQKAYRKNFFRGNRLLSERVHYAFALMYQRAAYFVDSRYQPKMLEEKNANIFSKKMADYLRLAGKQGFAEHTQRQKLLEEGQKLLWETEQKEDELYIFYQNFLRPFLSILNQMDTPGQKTKPFSRKLPRFTDSRRFFLRSDSFEIKFALRMSIVLTLTLSYSMLSHVEHAFWLPLNAFLLLRPMYEDSLYRMKTRFIGTAAGCLLLAFLLPHFHGSAGHIIFASIVVIGLYTATPGTWQQALCSTCFALSMATLAIPEKTALTLRILYILISILLVLVVNKFFFPTNLKSQFWYNFQLLFHMQHSCLRILEGALTAKTEYDMICNAQLQYHLIHQQIIQYLKKQDSGQNDYYRKLLSISWKMISEMEQLFVLVNATTYTPKEAEILNGYILYADYVLNQVQEMLNMKTECTLPRMDGIQYCRFIENQPQLSFLMTRYSKHLSCLYQAVCKNSCTKQP